MMPRKKRITLLIIITVLVIVTIIVGLGVLYLKTDLFKSNQVLFFKYLGNNLENVNNYFSDIGDSSLESLLNENKYKTETSIKVNYMENIGTSSENTDNVINELKINANGEADKANNYYYQNIKLNQKDNQLLEIEYIKDDDLAGIRFSDLFKQYILVQNSNLKELFNKIGYDNEQLQMASEQLEMQTYSTDWIGFNNEEIETLRNKYIGILGKNIAKSSFKKESDVTITINEKNVYTNCYTMTVTKEQLNNAYINILEELKQDVIILSKMEKMENEFNRTDIREGFIQKIDNTINEINQTNIGTEENKIIVYENQKNTVRTVIETQNSKITLDWLNENKEKYAELYLEEDGIEQKINMKSSMDGWDFNIATRNGEVENIISLTQEIQLEGNECTRNTIVIYDDDENKVQTNVEENITIIEELENEIVIDDTNSIVINDLDEASMEKIVTKIALNVAGKLDEIKQTVSTEELSTVLETIGIMNKVSIIEGTGISETEKARFNAEYEMLKGENLSKDNVLNIINAIQESFYDFEVISNTELKIVINKDMNNEEKINTLKSFIEKHNKKYNVDVLYDENGLVNAITLKIIKEKK